MFCSYYSVVTITNPVAITFSLHYCVIWIYLLLVLIIPFLLHLSTHIFLFMCTIYLCMILQTKVDLTKYVESHKFVFDEVFGHEASNEQIYARTCKPLVEFALNKGRATCFAYGQTGSGKSFFFIWLYLVIGLHFF